MGRVFIIDDDKQASEILKKRGFDIFTTQNAYNLVRYSHELAPSLYVVKSNLRDTNYYGLVKHLIDNHYTDNAPLVVLHQNGKKSKIFRQGVAHYISENELNARLPELAEAYCKGGRKYDLLMVEHIASKRHIQTLMPANLAAFKVCDTQAARIFMQKNNVEAVALYCPSDKYDELRSKLDFEKIFHVDNPENVKDLVSFIK